MSPASAQGRGVQESAQGPRRLASALLRAGLDLAAGLGDCCGAGLGAGVEAARAGASGLLGA
ncbi:MAG: hypothetical protein R2724_19285 [Bryobacterales bacterium]